LSTSLSMLRATPGYWILIASSRPSTVVPAWTWPIDAAAIGSKSKWAKRRSQSGPQEARSTLRSWASGMASPASRRVASASAASGVSRSSASRESSCPSFIEAPRMDERERARRRAFAPLSSGFPELAPTPVALLKPSAAPPIAILPASQPR
jgi:hypothetical protein